MPTSSGVDANSLRAAIEQTTTEDEQWISIHRRMLAMKGFYLDRNARILDFGCGSGGLVYQYRDTGFDAYGFEIRPIVNLRKPEDERFFLYSNVKQPAREFQLDPDFRIPAADNSFDFVYSLSVLEHVLDLNLALSECARILKPGGISLHVFPARYMRKEPHIYVPFGGAIQNRGWYLFWALLGVRAEWQTNLNARQTAQTNLDFARGFLSYPGLREILHVSASHFSRVEVDPRLWELRVPNRTTFWASMLHMPLLHRIVHWWYCRFCTLVLFTIK